MKIVGKTNNIKIAINQITRILAVNGVLLSEVDVVFSEVKKVIQGTPVGGKYIPLTSEQQEKLIELLKVSFQDIQ